MKNKLTDLNDHLFAQMERLGDEDLSEDQLKSEIARAKSMASISDKIIDNGRLQLDAAELATEFGRTLPSIPTIGLIGND